MNGLKTFRASIESQNWEIVSASLDVNGNALLPNLLSTLECEKLIGMYAEEHRYRTRIVMGRHGFGLGEYKYFAYPLPDLITRIRAELYFHLAPLANRWNELMGIEVQFPQTIERFLELCHASGQMRPTPLILKYGEGDYNCLHQDLYGEHVFPLQVAILLSRPGENFTGGEFVMTESGARNQRFDVVPLGRGDGVVFTVNQRPSQGKRPVRKLAMRHGVSKIRSGARYTAGLIFHDSR